MARLTDVVQSALGRWWDVVSRAGYGGYQTTDVISAASDIAQQEGRSLAFSESSAIATLFGYARRMSNAADFVQSLDESAVITPEAISTPPWARDEVEQLTLPIWHVHFDLTAIDETGNVTTSRKVSVFRMTLPETLGEILDGVNTDAEAMSAKYNVQFVSAQVMEIQSV